MPRIFIESKDVAFVGDPAEHLYLVYRDDLGNEFVIRGGPENEGNLFNLGKLVIQDNILLSQSKDSRGSATPSDRNNRQLDLGRRNAADVWAIMKQQASNVDQLGVDYKLTGPNSNSLVASVLRSVGIDPFFNLPIGKGTTSFPRISTSLIFDTVLVGTPSSDIIVGGYGDDQLSGDLGDDVLNGGTGRNNYYFDGLEFGKDVVTDSGGASGQLLFNAIPLKGTAKEVTNKPTGTTFTLSRDDGTNWQLTRKNTNGAVDAAGTNLEIKQISDSGANNVTVQNFKTGMFGINLGEKLAAKPQAGNFPMFCEPEKNYCEITGTNGPDVIISDGNYQVRFSNNIWGLGGGDYIEFVLKDKRKFPSEYNVISIQVSGDAGDDTLVASADYPGESIIYLFGGPGKDTFVLKKSVEYNQNYKTDPFAPFEVTQSESDRSFTGYVLPDFEDGEKIDIRDFENIRSIEDLKLITTISDASSLGGIVLPYQGILISDKPFTAINNIPFVPETFIFHGQSADSVVALPDKNGVVTSGEGESTLYGDANANRFVIVNAQSADVSIYGMETGDKIDTSQFNSIIRSFWDLHLHEGSRRLDGNISAANSSERLLAQQSFSLGNNRVSVFNAHALGYDDFLGNAGSNTPVGHDMNNDSSGAIAAGVLVPLLLVGVGAGAALLYFYKKNPEGRVHQALDYVGVAIMSAANSARENFVLRLRRQQAPAQQVQSDPDAPAATIGRASGSQAQASGESDDVEIATPAHNPQEQGGWSQSVARESRMSIMQL